MTLTNGIISALAPNLDAQLTDAKQTAQQAAGVVAGWGALIAIELAVVIWLLARRRGV